jgi:hypothetical protein
MKNYWNCFKSEGQSGLYGCQAEKNSLKMDETLKISVFYNFNNNVFTEETCINSVPSDLQKLD